jgi:amino acid adenylation domain-containing protein
MNFWLSQFSDGIPILDLPLDRPRPARFTFRGARETMRIEPALAAALRRTGAQHGSSLFMTLLSAFQTLLHRLSNQDDLVVGVPFSGAIRTEPGGDRLFANTTNVVLLRSRVGEGSRTNTFTDLLAANRRLVIDAAEHQHFFFGRLIDALSIPFDGSRPPLFSVLFNVESGEYRREVEQLKVELVTDREPFLSVRDTSMFEIYLNVAETGNGLFFRADYNTDLFDAATIRRWLAHLRTLLDAIVLDPRRPILDLPLMHAAERARILHDWNRTALDFPTDAALHRLFEDAARRHPDACAIIDHGDRITYQDLDRRANRIAHRLRSLNSCRGTGVQPVCSESGILPGEPHAADTSSSMEGRSTPDRLETCPTSGFVAVCMNRSADMIAAMLGVLKSGAAYVPIDPNAPHERIAVMLADARPHVVLCDARTLASHARHHADVRWENVATTKYESATPLPDATRARDLAVLIYTSGSTGKPKGVALEHRNAVNFVTWARTAFSAGELAGVLAATSICFDLSIFEIFVPLASGGTVILANNILELPELPDAHAVTLVNTVPSAIAELARVHSLPPNARTVFLAGEPLSGALVAELYASGNVQRVCDGYGPTETGYATFAERKPGEPATIGRPIANTHTYLLDARMQPLPPGIPGELWIGGACVARGYWQRPDLTAERFIGNPFTEEFPDAPPRLYRTGDIARWRDDGQLVYLGRADRQVKLRGYRVELGEIEAVLREHPDIADAAVIAQSAGTEEARLIAYIVSRNASEPTARTLRASLKRKLPDYMLPAAFVPLERLPLTRNGKLDRRALPEPDPARCAGDAEFVAPRTAIENRVADVWRDVLKLDRVSIQDDFFALGGHSLTAMQTVARLRSTLPDLTVNTMFAHPTISGLLAALGIEAAPGEFAAVGEREEGLL